MAVTAGVINSTSFAIYVDDNKVAHGTDASLSISHSPRDITSKDSPGWRELAEGLRQATLSFGALYAMDAAYGIDDLFSSLSSRSEVTVKLSDEVTDDTYYEASGYIGDFNINSPGAEENAACDGSFEINGAITQNTHTV